MQLLSLWVKQLSVWLLLAGSGLTLLASYHVRQEIGRDAVDSFSHSTEQITNRIADRMQTLGLILRASAGVFSASPDIGRDAWRSYVAQLQPQLNLPGVQGIGFAQAIPAGQLDAHVAAVRAEGFPDYTVSPQELREFYTSIIYLEPFAGRNLRAFGYDMFSEPVRRAAMEFARDSGHPGLSGKVRLLQETETDVQAGTLLFFPVYRNDMPVATEAERQAALLGWTYSPFRMNDLVVGILGDWQQQWTDQIELHIYDGVEADPEALLYSNGSIHDTSLTHFDPGHLHQRLDINGHSWLLVFDSNPSLANLDYSPAWGVLGGGFTISLLLFALLNSVLATRQSALNIADGLALKVKAREQQLEESEYRWRFALEGSGDGLWDWDVANSTVYFSHIWKEMLGYEDAEIGNGLNEWESRVHPEDLAATTKLIEAHLSGKTNRYRSEHRILCKDGSYKWILDRGMVVARSKDGNPLRMLGTHKDISESRRLTQALQEREDELIQAQRLSKSGNWKLDVATGKIYWSEQLYRISGFESVNEPPNFMQQANLFTPDSWAALNSAVEQARLQGIPFELELETIAPGGRKSWVLAKGEAKRAPDGKITELVGIVQDITDSKNAARRIQHLGDLYAAQSACNTAVVHCHSRDELLARICEIVVTNSKMQLAWIGLLDTETGNIVPRFWAGPGTAYLDGIKVSVKADDPYGRGPTGTAVRENEPNWVQEFKIDSTTSPWHVRAAQFGWVSSAALPLCEGGVPIGALTFYSTEIGWFDTEIRTLLEEMSRDISYALDKFAVEASARIYQKTLKQAEQRFSSLIEQSMVGAFIIQDQRFVYVNPHLEDILGYPHDGSLLQHPPGGMVLPKDANDLMQAIDSLQGGKSIEHMFTAVCLDGRALDVGTTITMSTYQGRPAIIGLIHDLSNRKVAEAQIKRYAQDLEKVFLQIVGVATNLVEMRDPYTVGHEKEVAEIAVAIGKDMQLDAFRLEGLRVGGYLHDVGKVTVPVEILSKPGRITALEFELIKGHPQAGYDILKDVDFPWPVAQIALQHHERMDGSGYPQGLKGEGILLEARIVAVADVIESMSSHRPYRAGLGIARALEEIESGRGSKFDAAVVDAALRVFREKGFTITE